MAAARVDADREEAREQPGFLGHQAEVGGQRQVEAGAECGALHGRDRRHRQVRDARERRVDGHQVPDVILRARVRSDPSQQSPVGTRAEYGACRPNNRRTDRRIAVQRAAGGDKVPCEVQGDAVAAPRGIEGDNGHAVCGYFDKHVAFSAGVLAAPVVVAQVGMAVSHRRRAPSRRPGLLRAVARAGTGPGPDRGSCSSSQRPARGNSSRPFPGYCGTSCSPQAVPRPCFREPGPPYGCTGRRRRV